MNGVINEMEHLSLAIGLMMLSEQSHVNGYGFTHYDSLYNMTGKSKLMVTFMTN
ncbi:MAG: hypothetical protein WBL88_02695 [Nitrososphaeraceae archaeon]